MIIILGTIFILYDIILIILSPGTFLDILTSFTHIWGVLGAYLIFVGIYRKKTGHSFWKIWKKWIKIAFVVCAGLGTVISITSLIFILNPKIADINESAEYLILLGGGIDKNGKLPTSVQNRVEKAAEYLILHPETICIATGGTLKWLPYAEAPAIKQELVNKGISQNRILIEDQAYDTIENFKFSCKILAEHQGVPTPQILNSKIIVVTNAFHLRRAERLASRMGFTNIKGLAAKVGSISVVHLYVREICAYLKLNLRIFLTQQPQPLQ